MAHDIAGEFESLKERLDRTLPVPTIIPIFQLDQDRYGGKTPNGIYYDCKGTLIVINDGENTREPATAENVHGAFKQYRGKHTSLDASLRAMNKGLREWYDKFSA